MRVGVALAYPVHCPTPMNTTIRTTAISALTLALLAFFSAPASAQACYPQSLSRGRRLITPAHAPAHQHYTPGHYETIRERVLVPGASYRVWVRARYSTHHGLFGFHHRQLVSPGHYEYRSASSRYEYRSRRVWIPGHYD